MSGGGDGARQAVGGVVGREMRRQPFCDMQRRLSLLLSAFQPQRQFEAKERDREGGEKGKADKGQRERCAVLC